MVNHLTKKSKVTYDLKYLSLWGMYVIFFSFQKHYGLWCYKLFNIGIQWGNVLMKFVQRMTILWWIQYFEQLDYKTFKCDVKFFVHVTNWNSCGCKWNQMSQWCYFTKGLFCPKIFFSYKWIFEHFLFFQFVIMNACNCPSTWEFLFNFE
jgi:hypothetical protein